MNPELLDLEALRDKLAKLAASKPSNGFIVVKDAQIWELHAFAHRACELAYERLDIMAEAMQRDEERRIQEEADHDL